jgi:hypothetical protein
MAVSLDEIEAHLPKSGAKPRKPDPAAADRTYVVDDEPPAPAPKRLPAALAAKAAAESAAAPSASKEVAEAEPKFVVRAGPDLGKSFPLTKDLTLVGRGLDADIVINDASASRKHFNVVRTLSGWKLVDLGSGNGTKVDGSKVAEVALKSGMKIELGGTTLEFVMDEPKAVPPKAQVEPARAEPAPSPRGTLTDDTKRPERKRDAARVSAQEDPEIEALKRSAKAPEPEDAEKTSFGDVASLQLDPAWEARRLKQRRELDEPKVVDSGTSEVEAADIEEAPRSGVGKKIAIAGLLVGVLGGGFVAADKFAGLGIIFPKPAPTVAAKDDAGSDDADKGKATGDSKESDADKAKKSKEAEAKVKEGDAAVKEGRLISGLTAYRAALELDSLVDGAEGGVALVGEELSGVSVIAKAIGLQGEGKYAEAAIALGGLKEGSAPRRWADVILKDGADAHVVALLGESYALLGKKEPAKAKAAFTLATKLAGADFEAVELKPVIDAFKDALARAEAADADMADADPKTKAEPVDLKAAFDAYAKGDINAAVNGFDSLQDPAKKASRAEVGKAMAASAAATLVEDRMKAASALAAKPDEALPLLRTARKADALLGGGQRPKIEPAYTKALGPTAKKALDGKELLVAVIHAKVILAVDAANADAKAIVEAAAKEGKTTLADAKSAAKEDPDKALQSALRAMRLLPASDPDFAEAEKLVTGLSKTE